MAGLAAVTAVLLNKVDWTVVAEALKKADGRLLLGAFAVAAVQPLLTAMRLNIYLKASQLAKPYGRCLSAILAAMSLNAVLPARGGDLVKVTFLEDDLRKLPPMVGVTILERVFDILILCLLALGGAMLTDNPTATRFALLATCAPVGALLTLNFADKVPVVGGKLATLAQACRTAMGRPRLLIGAWTVAIVCWTSNLLVMSLLLKAVGTSVGFGTVAATMPLAILVGILPLSISGMGTRDGALVLLLKGVAAPGIVLAGTLLYTAAVYWMLALIGLAFLGRETLRKTLGRTRHNQGILKKHDTTATT